MNAQSINNTQFNFQKKLVAKGAYLNKNKPKSCNIYQLESESDEEYFKQLGKKYPNWKNMGFYWTYNKAFQDKKSNFINKTFVLENEKNFSLGHYIISKDEKGGLELNYIQTYKNPNLKYVGETMIAYLAQKAKSENSPYICAQCILKDAKNFYYKSNFKMIKSDNLIVEDGYLYSNNYNRTIEQNTAHTKKKIELVI